MTAWLVITIFARPPLPMFVGGFEAAPAPGGILSIFGHVGYGVIGSSIVRAPHGR